jgi:hypothetical protein
LTQLDPEENNAPITWAYPTHGFSHRSTQLSPEVNVSWRMSHDVAIINTADHCFSCLKPCRWVATLQAHFQCSFSFQEHHCCFLGQPSLWLALVLSMRKNRKLWQLIPDYFSDGLSALWQAFQAHILGNPKGRSVSFFKETLTRFPSTPEKICTLFICGQIS